MNSLNIRPYLFGVEQTRNNRSTAATSVATVTNSAASAASAVTSAINSWTPSFSSFSPSLNATQWKDAVKRVAVYLAAVLLVLLVLLLLVHFFIRPVFRWRPGAPGWIPVPGWDDGALFWKDGAVLVPATDLPIQNQYMDYTLQVDLFLENPLAFATQPRLLFARGSKKASPTGDTLLGILEPYNLAVALKPDTNDLLVSTLNHRGHMETAVITNVPVQEVFRLTVVLMEKAMEVYINGHLVQTTTFQAPPKDVRGAIEPAKGQEATIARMRNLKIWSRILTTPEIRDASPTLASAKDMGAGPMPTSTVCQAQG